MDNSGTTNPAAALRAAIDRIAKIELELAAAHEDLAAAARELSSATLSETPRDAYTLDEVGERLGFSRSTIYEMRRVGIIKVSNTGPAGKSPRIFQADLDAYIAETRGQAS